MSSEDEIDEAQEYSDNFDSSPQASRHQDAYSSSGSDMYQLSSSSTLLSVSKSDKSNQPRGARTGFREDEELNGILPGARYSDSSGSSLDAMKLSSGSYEAEGPLLRSPEVTAKRDGNQTIEEQPNEENEANSEASHQTHEEGQKSAAQGKRLENAKKTLASLKKTEEAPQKPAEKRQGSARTGVTRSKNYRLGTTQFPNVTKVGKGPEKFVVQSSIPKPKRSVTPLAEEQKSREDAATDEKHAVILAEKTQKKTKQVNEFVEYQTKLIQKEREYRMSPEPAKGKPQVARKSPPKVAPQPRSLGANLYKLHQLAESVPGKGQRMTLGSLSGTLLDVIRVTSSMISEEFADEEVAEELQNAKKALSLIQTGAKDCVRNEKDYTEDSKTRLDTYKSLLEEHQRLQAEILRLQSLVSESNKRLGVVESSKAVVKLANGTYMRAGLLPNSALSMKVDGISASPSVDLLRDDPVDAVVNKIERNGMSLSAVFNLIDIDKDGVLTLAEIREQMPKVSTELELTAEETTLLMKKLDENSDGVVTCEEFLGLLDPKLAVQREYRAIIGDVDANDPIVFEEKILDMRMRGRLYQEEMPNLLGEYKKNLPSEQRLVKRILLLEQKMNDKKIEIKPKKESTKVLTHQVNTLRFQKEETEQTLSANLLKQQSNLQRTQATLAYRMQQRSALQMQIAKGKAESSYGQKQLESLEVLRDNLNSRNRVIAIMMIQAVVRRWKQRRRFKAELVSKRHAARVIQKRFREHLFKQKETAATKIQSHFRRKIAEREKEQLKIKKKEERLTVVKPPSPEIVVQESSPAEPSFAPSQEEPNASQTFSFLESKDHFTRSDSPMIERGDATIDPAVSSAESRLRSQRNRLSSEPPAYEGGVKGEEEDLDEQPRAGKSCAVCGLDSQKHCLTCRELFCAMCYETEHHGLRKPHEYETLETEGNNSCSSLTQDELDLIADVKATLQQSRVDFREVLKIHDDSDSGLMTTEQLLSALQTRKLRLSDAQVGDLLELAYAHFYDETAQGYDYQKLSEIL